MPLLFLVFMAACGPSELPVGTLSVTQAVHLTQSVDQTPLATFVDGIDLERSAALAAASSVRLHELRADLLDVTNGTNRNVELTVDLWDVDQVSGEPWVRLGSASFVPSSTGTDLPVAIPGVDAVLASILERARLEGRLTTRFRASASGTPAVDLLQYRFRMVATFELP